MTHHSSNQEPEQEPQVPDAAVDRRRWHSSQLIWLVPIVALVIGLSLAVQAYLQQGSTITISFKSGEGIEAGKTKIRYKNVQVGLVSAVTIAKDRSSVLVTAEMTRDADPFLKEDTRFWVVRPRLTGSSITGLGTLTGGSFIAMDAGSSSDSRASFVGLDIPPVVAMDVPGRQFVLHSYDVGSLSVGSPLFYRHLQVGQVLSTELDKDGETVILHVFVQEPYDRFVRANTLFWHASGIDLNLDADGMKINTESLLSIMLGGIAFQTPDDSEEGAQAEANRQFMLFATKDEAMKRLDSIVENYRLVFRESVRGLAVGAPVDLRGVAMGEVTSITAELDAKSRNVAMAVNIRIYPERLKPRSSSSAAKQVRIDSRTLLDSMVQHGFRAQLRSGSLVTGQIYVALDFFPEARRASINWNGTPPELPTMPGAMAQFQQSLMKIVAKLENVPFDQLAGDVRTSVQSLDGTLKSADRLLNNVDTALVPELRRMLENSRTTLAAADKALAEMKQAMASDGQLQLELRDTMQEVGRAARSLKGLAEYLEQHPEALLWGKKEDGK